MGLFSGMRKKLAENIYLHGSYLTDSSADVPRRIEKIVDLLMPFIEPQSWEAVRMQILGIIREHLRKKP